MTRPTGSRPTGSRSAEVDRPELRRPVLRSLWHGLAGGLLAGSGVGLAEAVWILSQAPSGEYLALVHAAVLYGVVGGGLGLGFGAVLGLVRKLWTGLGDPLCYTLGVLWVLLTLGGMVLLDIVDRAVYLELGIPTGGLVAIGAVGFGGVVLGLWLGPVFLTRTPLKILLKPRGSLTAWSAVLALAALFALSPAEDPRGTAMAPHRAPPPDLGETPDIVLVTVESLRADAWNGPAFAALAAESTVYTQHRSHSSWTRPAVASLLTGELPAAHGCDVVTARLESERLTLPEVLQDRGYVTGSLPARTELERAFGFDQGFDWLMSMDERRGLLRSESGRRLLLSGRMRAAMRRARGVELDPDDVHRSADDVVAQSKRFIAANRGAGNRYMAWLHIAEPSLPWFSADGRRVVVEPGSATGVDREEARQLYLAEVARADAALGALIRWLKEAGAWEDMLLVVVGAHGEELFDHGGWGHGQTLYQEVVHTPLLVKLPGQVGGGERVETVVRTIDIAPTIANSVGAGVPPPWEGEPLPTRRVEPLRQIGVVPGEQRPVVAQLHLGGAVLEAIEHGGWKLIRANESNPRRLGRTEVYALDQDPSETRDLAGQAGPRQAELSRELRGLLARANSWRTRPMVPGP